MYPEIHPKVKNKLSMSKARKARTTVSRQEADWTRMAQPMHC